MQSQLAHMTPNIFIMMVELMLLRSIGSMKMQRVQQIRQQSMP